MADSSPAFHCRERGQHISQVQLLQWGRLERWLHFFRALPADQEQPHTFRKLVEERGELARKAAAWLFLFHSILRSSGCGRPAAAFADMNRNLRLRLVN